MLSKRRETERVRRLWKEGKSEEKIARVTGLNHQTVSHIIAGIKAVSTIRRQKRRRSKAASDAHETRRKEWRKMKKSLLILDCTSPRREKKSEGALLNELIDILNAKTRGPYVKKDFVTAFDRASFLDSLENSDHGVIHISAHGGYSEKTGPVIHLPFGASIRLDELENVLSNKGRSRIQRLVFLSACEAGQKELAMAFSLHGCRYFIAPKDEVCWYDAAAFLTMFYRLLLVEEHKSPWVAFRTANKVLRKLFPKFSGSWRYFEDGVECFDR